MSVACGRAVESNVTSYGYTRGRVVQIVSMDLQAARDIIRDILDAYHPR